MNDLQKGRVKESAVECKDCKKKMMRGNANPLANEFYDKNKKKMVSLSPKHFICDDCLKRQQEEPVTDKETQVEKCDSITSKETPEIDTKEKAEIPAEELMIEKNGQWVLKKSDDSLEKAPVSEAQRKAMHAAAAGDSELGIPKSVGKEFADKDPGGKLPERAEKSNGALSDREPTGMMGERLRMSENGQWDIEKVEMGRGGKPKDISMFTSDHINAVVKMPHADAKAHAHAAVDASAAKPENKLKAKKMIDSSKSSNHLAMGMGNFLLASEGLGTGSKRS